MWIPVGPQHGQAIYIVDKDADGNLKSEKLMDVRYGSLTSIELQLSVDY